MRPLPALEFQNTSRRTEGIFEALTRRTEAVNLAASAGGEGVVGVAAPVQLSPDHRSGVFSR